MLYISEPGRRSDFFIFNINGIINCCSGFKNAEGIEEMAPCVAGNIIGSYGEQYVARWIVLCVVSFIVVTLVGAFLARKREF